MASKYRIGQSAAASSAIDLEDPISQSAAASSDYGNIYRSKKKADISQPPGIDQATASDDRITVTVQAPQSAPSSSVSIIDSSIRAQVTDEPYIYRAPHLLRKVNEGAYEPTVVSIGPYHHGKEHLKSMEAIKKSCFLDNYKKVANRIVETMKSREKEIRDCYEEPSKLCSNKFVDMMVYDGCFIIHLIRCGCKFVDARQHVFEQRGIQVKIKNDLLLLENQLPFFVLDDLYRIIMKEDVDRCLVSDARHLFKLEMKQHQESKAFKHLLELVHSCYIPSSKKEESEKAEIKKPESEKAESEKAESKTAPSRSTMFIGSATELDDAGIDFSGETLEKMKSKYEEQGIETMFDIKFIKETKVRWIPILTDTKVLIPTLTVNDWTEREFRNYIAYEQFTPRNEPAYFSDYARVMDNLISTSKDVKLLHKKGIIDNWLGDDEAVANLFNRLLDSVFLPDDFYYAEIFGRVNKHCQNIWHERMASLKKNYFNSPWSFISFLAAAVLVLLTIVQTILSVLSYFDEQN